MCWETLFHCILRKCADSHHSPSHSVRDLEEWTNNDVQIETWKDHFLKEYPKIFNDSSENEVEMDTGTRMETKPTIDREKKLRKVEEKLLSKRTNERFIDYFDVSNDPKLTVNSGTKDNLFPKRG